MTALLRKEISAFFSTLAGYLIIGIFLIICSLFLWVLDTPYNIMESGFADLSPYFDLAPWIFLFLIPAITMRSFTEEQKQGTLELLLTKPLSYKQLIIGKFLGALIIICIALLPGLLYIGTLISLGYPNTIDSSGMLGAYISLVLLCSTYVAIGIFCATLTSHQIIAFLISGFISFVFYVGFGQLADYKLLGSLDYAVEQIGMQLHYNRISKGMLDTRDAIYFLSIVFMFLGISYFILKKETPKKNIKWIGIIIISTVLMNVFGHSLYKRIDFTKDQRFTVSEATKDLIRKAPGSVVIEILLEGDFPSEFRKLQSEIGQMLTQFNAINPNVKHVFINPIENPTFRKETLEELQKYGLRPMEVSVQSNGTTEIETVVPWAIMNYKNRSVKIPLVKNTLGATTEERVNNSIQQLEYIFADGLKKLLEPKKHKIAVLKGNGQLPDINIADFIRTLQEYYFVGAFTLDSVAGNPQKTLSELQKFDLVINAKPTIAFSEKEKYVLDQFIMQGGKSLWLTESVAMEIDSLFTKERTSLATIRDLKLNDLFFSYGVRINPVLVNDLYSAPLVLASGQGDQTQFTPYPWFYASLTKSKSNHPIVKNIESVRFEFANQIDTLKNELKKTILLSSSEKSKLDGVPKPIKLDIIKQKPEMSSYTQGPQNLAVLLEGSFKSNYKNRVKPFSFDAHTDLSDPTKMVIIADGDVIKNSTRRNRPLALGLDQYLNIKYGNKEFLLNAINYLLDDSGLIQIRGKEITVAFLDPEKVSSQRNFWRFVHVIVPIVLLVTVFIGYTYYRKKRYQY